MNWSSSSFADVLELELDSVLFKKELAQPCVLHNKIRSHLVLILDWTPDFIIVSVPVGGLNLIVVPTTGAIPAAIPPNPGAPNCVPGCAVPAIRQLQVLRYVALGNQI